MVSTFLLHTLHIRKIFLDEESARLKKIQQENTGARRDSIPKYGKSSDLGLSKIANPAKLDQILHSLNYRHYNNEI